MTGIIGDIRATTANPQILHLRLGTPRLGIMDIRIILNPEDIGTPLDQSSMKFSTAHRR